MIQLNNVSKYYPAGFGKTYVLRNIDLGISSGEFVSIMG
ncbi:MAG: ABC transporter ATP-binding protein, partial [Spirosomataceae bacterium]